MSFAGRIGAAPAPHLVGVGLGFELVVRFRSSSALAAGSDTNFGIEDHQQLYDSSALLEADLVYVRDFVHAESMSSEQLKHLGQISHSCYGSFDLAGGCVALLEQRNALAAGALQQYIDLLRRGG